MAADMRRAVNQAITWAVQQHALWSPGARLIVAVSGGADSLCVLGALLALRERGHRLAPGELIVAHLDHGLRGEEGHEDARFVQRLAAELDIPCVTEQAEIVPPSEDQARRARYAFLRRILAEYHAERIVTGHTRDDQAETILLHWLRGSGLAGLRGMAPLREDIARPLLDVTHEQTLAYCAALGWQPHEDITNTDPRYLRNRIRHELLPQLETYNPAIRELLIRNGELLADDDAYLEAEAQAAWADVAEELAPGSVCLRREPLHDLSAAIRHRLYREVVRRIAEPDVMLEARHIVALDKHLVDGHSGAVLHLAGGLHASLKYDALAFRTNSTISSPRQGREMVAPSALNWQLSVPGAVEMPELGWRIHAWRIDGAPGSEDAGELPPAPELPPLGFADRSAEIGRAESRVYLDAATIGNMLAVRTWQPGDRFRPLGMRGEKKLQDYFSDAKVPRSLRARVPLVFNGKHLVWVAGLRLDDRVRLMPATQAVVVLQLELLTE